MSPSRTTATRNEAAQLAAKRGLPPGSAVYTGEFRVSEVDITTIHYDSDGASERTVEDAEACFPLASTGVTWINVDGLHDLPTIEHLAKQLEIHPLTVEDALNVSTPPKAEDFGERLYVGLVMVDWVTDVSEVELRFEQVSFVLGPTWVLTLQEQPGDVFAALRRRILAGAGRWRQQGSDRLLHALMDSVVDAYFVVLQRIEGSVQELEDQAMAGQDDELPRKIHALRIQLQAMRRALSPLQTVITTLVRTEKSELFESSTEPYFRDLLDHARQATEILAGAQDRLRSVMDLHLAQASHRLNEVMEQLTTVATIFIPLTLIAGIYGMNFTWMPELQWEWGYPAVLGAMVLSAVGMAVWLRRR